MDSQYFFSLGSIKPKSCAGGSVKRVTVDDVPGFVNISFENLRLKKRGSLSPVWHPNAAKLGYCIEGNCLVTIRTPTKAEHFTVEKGEIFFIPEGFVYHIENIGDGDSVINFAMNNAAPETMHLTEAISSISDSVFNSTFNTQTGFVENLKNAKDGELIKILPSLAKTLGRIESPYKFDIGVSNKPIVTKGGYLQVGTAANLPILEGLGLLGFGLNPNGIVEPHWHTNAGELVYIVKGQTRITVLSPNGHVDVMEVNEGEGAFAPASYFHNIENIGPGNVEVIAFFTHADPNYIGIGEVIGSYSNELLTSVFDTPSDYWETFKMQNKPLVIGPSI